MHNYLTEIAAEKVVVSKKTFDSRLLYIYLQGAFFFSECSVYLFYENNSGQPFLIGSGMF